ncbi:MAG: VOC family protein [Propionibacteriaceae bacterium]
MKLENIVWDARDPQRLGRFWAAALGAEVITDVDEGVEARLTFGDEFFLDLCFPRVEVGDDVPAAAVPQRLHLDLTGGAEQEPVVDRLLGLGAARADVGQGDVPWVVLADPEGNAFCVMEDRPAYRTGSGPIAALPLDSADPERDARFWAAVTGWVPAEGVAPQSLRHPSGRGPLLELCPEPEPRRGKSTLHLDVRVADDDHDPLGFVRDLGGSVLEQPAPGLPWTVCADPSGNEVCLLGVHPPLG